MKMCKGLSIVGVAFLLGVSAAASASVRSFPNYDYGKQCNDNVLTSSKNKESLCLRIFQYI